MQKLQERKNLRFGFTLTELLVVVFIIALLATQILPHLQSARAKAYHARTLAELKSIVNAIELYKSENNGEYPEDVSRNIPSGIESYLASNDNDNWPSAPWPGSVYDWDNWEDPDNPGERIYQISIRFCPIGGPLSACRFPDLPWAEDFQVNSSAYYCIAGSCRAHDSEPIDYPGYCLNCASQLPG